MVLYLYIWQTELEEIYLLTALYVFHYFYQYIACTFSINSPEKSPQLMSSHGVTWILSTIMFYPHNLSKYMYNILWWKEVIEY